MVGYKLVLVLLTFFTVYQTGAAIEKTYNFPENTGTDYSIGQLELEGGSDYHFSGPGQNICNTYFKLVPSTGEIQTRINIDREQIVEEIDSDTISCEITYSTADLLSNLIQANFHIQDINDITPYFFELRPQLFVYENVAVGGVLTYLMPIDLDAGKNGTVNFSIVEGNEEGFFRMAYPSVNSPDRLLILNKTINYETHKVFHLMFNISDEGKPPRSTIENITINIRDVNDQSPSFSQSSITFNVPENHLIGIGHAIGIINATDEDSPTHSQIFYQINVNESADSNLVEDYFAINTTNGELYLLKKLDYDLNTRHEYRFVVEARNPESPIGTKAYITVQVMDVNDEVPYLLFQPPHIIDEQKSTSITLIFIDDDKGENDNKLNKYNVTFNPPVTYFSSSRLVHETQLISITINQTINRELIPVLNMSITVYDNGTPPLSNTTTYTFIVEDINDNPPHFTRDNFTVLISDSFQSGKEILNVMAFDPDAGENGSITFSLINVTPSVVSSWFNINELTGGISLTTKPNYDLVNGHVQLTVMAKDNGENQMSSNVTVFVTITTAITFKPMSFQLFDGVDLSSLFAVYMEFKTDQENGLLLYQKTSSNFMSLEIINNTIVFNKNGRIIPNDKTTITTTNTWYTILLTGNELQVWKTNDTYYYQSREILQTDGYNTANKNSLQVGGVENMYMIPERRLNSITFTGCIRDLFINDIQVDLTSSIKDHNTIVGCHSTSCSAQSCSKNSHCTPYSDDNNNVCYCENGFAYETCNDEEDYSPLSLSLSNYVQFDLGHDYFYSRWGPLSPYQSIKISFIPSNPDFSGVLFYSKTNASIQRLEYEKTLRYAVFTAGYRSVLSLTSQDEIIFKPATEYEIELLLPTSAGSDVRILLTEFGEQPQEVILHRNQQPTTNYLLVQGPATHLSIGGTDDSMASYVTHSNFSACITEFVIDNMRIPLRGLMTARAGNFTVRGSTTNDILPSCLPCSICSPTCTLSCFSGSRLLPTPSTTSSTDNIGDPTSEPLKLQYIIMIAVGILICIVLTFIVMAVAIRCAYRYGRNKRVPQMITQITYHSQNGECCSNNNLDKTTDIHRIQKKTNNYVNTPLPHKTPYNDVDGDSVLDEFYTSHSCRKSTSQETGFHTASEQDGPTSTRSSPKRALSASYTKNSEQDSDFTSFETDSEDLTTSGIEEAMTPNEMRLVSSGSMMGVPSAFRLKNPLTPQEKNILTPFMPNSAILMSGDETDTEISTNGNRQRRYSDNVSLGSNNNMENWYKTSSPSTIVDDEPMVLYNAPKSKKNRHKPANLPHIKQYKSSSPQNSPYSLSNNHIPLSSSPLTKSHHRSSFDYPPCSPLGANGPMYYNPIEQARLPVISESLPAKYGPPPPGYRHIIYPHDIHPPSVDHLPPHLRPEVPYYMGYQGTNLTPMGGSGTYREVRDLNSFSKVNPITYWEQQQRLRPIVDQDDPLHFLTEPCRKFDDVSTTPSVAESTVIDDKESSIIAPINIHRPAAARGVHNDYVMMPRLLAPPKFDPNEDKEDEEEMTISQSENAVFPSADCHTPTNMDIINTNTTTCTLTEQQLSSFTP